MNILYHEGSLCSNILAIGGQGKVSNYTKRGSPIGRIYRGIQWGDKLKSDLHLENDPTVTPLQLPTRKVLSQSKKISKRC